MATVLKMLLAERHLKSHPDFLTAYDRCAAQLDPPIPPGHGPAKAQYYQWLSGRMVGFPRDYHCRVLERMFPGWTVEGLFQMANSTPGNPRLQGTGPSGTDIQLEAFLGAEMTTRGTTLVYPRLELTRPSVDVLKAAGISRPFGKQSSVDVPSMVTENDVRGLLYVLSLLQRQTGIRADVRSDRDMVARSDRPYISFGLSGNDCTDLYLEAVERPLFTVHNSAAADGARSVHLRLSDGSEYDSDDDRNIGVIARVRPSPEVHPDRYWIYCGGLGPHGTAGAGWYLATSWSPLQQRAGDREFVAVIGVDEYSDRTTSLEHLLIASTE
ncbi:hypothetical protein OHA40_25675 [Nocardia sp. NBC_00508]|uniref:hypothetical protein n=1 Tax=Nocardia sp. NBC_00508 TaxID=2975992 RepID=UPI002E7FD12B|nr:hypothetical protein [Nocardia sp. NBC_00508]WUD65024.1 hypothetical protein OHA40_25675 [Nocardia sp. NBC_00508]